MRRQCWWTVLVVLAVGALVPLVGCSNDDDTSERPTTTRPPSRPLDAADAELLARQLQDEPECDELDIRSCLLPFPSDRFTTEDPDTDTGRRVALPTGLLANTSGETFDPTEWNRNDGFSPGTPVLVHLPGLDPEASGLPPIGDLSASLADDSPTVLIDLEDGRRILHWAELDAGAPSPEDQLLIIRPAENLPEGRRIAVALRNLRTSQGDLEAPLAFRVYRDRLTTELDAIEDRRPDMESMFDALAEAGVNRGELVLAWTFTVASERNLSERMLTIRDDAFERLGDAAPPVEVGEVIDDPGRLNPGIARLVRGSIRVPLYLTNGGEPGSRFNGATEGKLPTASGEFSASFSCQVPSGALQRPGTARMVVYGHGLLGSHREVENSQVAKIASTNSMVYCATDWIGMSTGDVPNALSILGNVSRFPTLADRVQQGILNTLFLARAMIHPEGFATLAPFQTPDGTSIIDGREAYYDGNSQGGIIGGAATAVAVDWKRAVLGVPGMNYSLLLSRSVDFDLYFTVLSAAYPSRIDQELIYAILQMLWDRAEANGYAAHMTTDPYPNTPKHQVILDVAFGDHQVAQVAAEIEARTIGAKVRQPALADGRHPDKKPFVGLEAPKGYPTTDSLLVYWDSGTLQPPPQNITPRASAEWKATCEGRPEAERKDEPPCADPHEDPRRAPESIRQKDVFFRPDGKIIDACDGAPCVAQPRSRLDY
jgi:hypothetical protein